ncbi:MAG TPA: Rieske 2Fe-2S domain-containing protein [Anaerolineae bacterium]|nr:Rieske 2Fe-2S domain-containing protein [Anaerolineae bacterium]HPL30046.1 Rieske 2Fe-2S domain-containing protein [Anaerolineae bacterium]
MRFQQGVDTLAQQKVLDPISQTIQDLVKGIYRSGGVAGRQVGNAMYGTWLGHPFHPSTTDVVVGSWTGGFVLDVLNAVTGSGLFARCADAAVAIGTLGALAAVPSGLTDFQHPSGEARRVGLVHGLLNIGGTLLQMLSLLQRARGERGSARTLSSMAFGGLLVSAYLGGDIIDKYQVGVNRAAGETVPADFVAVMREADLPQERLHQVDVNGSPVLLVRRGDRIYAMHATCTHMGGPLAQGTIAGDAVQCPWHGSRFAFDDGHVIGGPASYPERCLATRVRNGMIEVGPGAGLGRCRHEPVSTRQAQAEAERQMAVAPALR